MNEQLRWGSWGAAWGGLLMVGVLVTTGLERGTVTHESTASVLTALFDPASDTWTSPTSLATPRNGCVAALLSDGSVLFAGGTTPAARDTSEVWRPEGSTPGAKLATALTSPPALAVALSDGRAMLFDTEGEAQLWSKGAAVTTRTGPFLEGLGHFTAAPLADGRVLLANDALTDAWDASTNRWSSLAALPYRAPLIPRRILPLADGRSLVLADVSEGGAFILFFLSTPSVSSWQLFGKWPGADAALVATQVKGGQVLAARERGDGTRDAVLWEPGTGELTRANAPSSSVAGGTLVSLPDGRALLLGTGASEAWGPMDGEWKAVPAPDTSAKHGVALRLADGKVFLAGGDGPTLEKRDDHPMWWSVLALLVVVFLGGASAGVARMRPPRAALVTAIATACFASGWIYWAWGIVSQVR